MRRDAKSRCAEYVRKWESRGYPAGIPDEVPDGLARLRLAPSYKAIAVALLSNDHTLSSLGFSGARSDYYYTLKSIEKGGD